VRKVQISVKIGRQILLDAGFSANVFAYGSMDAVTNPAMAKFNVSERTSVSI
jgi:hypothetical protein